MTSLSNRLKGHAKKALDISPSKVVKGTASLIGNITKISLMGVGAGVYVVNKATQVGLVVGKAAYDEAKAGYQTTDNLLSTQKPQATRKPQFDEAYPMYGRVDDLVSSVAPEDVRPTGDVVGGRRS